MRYKISSIITNTFRDIRTKRKNILTYPKNIYFRQELNLNKNASIGIIQNLYYLNLNITLQGAETRVTFRKFLCKNINK